MNEITVFGNDELAINEIQDEESAIEFIKKLRDLEKLLKAAQQFHKRAMDFVRLEALTYARIAELGLTDKVPANNYGRVVIEWFESIGDDERNAAIDECCNRGVSIKTYWLNYVHEPIMVQRSMDYMEECGSFAIDEFKEKGEVNLNDYLDKFQDNKRISADVFKGYKDEVRNKLRRLGGHCIGDGDGVYVTAEKASSRADQIIMTKAKSIAADIKRMREFIDVTKPLPLVFDVDGRHPTDFTEESAINLAMSMCGMGMAHVDAGNKWVFAKMCNAVLAHLGTNVYQLFSYCVFYSKQYHGRPGKFDLASLGFPQEFADFVEREREEAGCRTDEPASGYFMNYIGTLAAETCVMNFLMKEKHANTDAEVA